MHNLIARTENREILIAMYETEEPNKKKFETGRIFHNDLYERELKQWQSSKIEYQVREEDQADINFLILSQYRVETSYAGVGKYNEVLEKGLDCTFLKNRLRFYDKFCCGISQWGKCASETETSYCSRNCTPVAYVALLPLEDKKENEAVDAIGFANWIRFETIEDRLRHYDPNENGKWAYWPIGGGGIAKQLTTAELYQLFKNPNKQ